MSIPEIKCKKYEVGDIFACKNNLEWEVLKVTDDGKEAFVLCLAYNICRWVDESGKHCCLGWPELISPHVRIEDTKVESPKPKRVVSREGNKIEHFKTLRDEFAMQFEPLTDEEIDDHIEGGETPEECQARLAYVYADAMMKEREK